MFVDSKLATKCINNIRVLAADTVEKAKSGHPGAPMGLAPLAFTLFSQHLRCNPANSQWPARDRFVLSNGHACALQYIMLHLLGYNLSLDDLKNFRQLDSVTPGHPESHITEGVEVTTGPLGQGVANAVGLAIAEAHLAATFNKPNFPLFDNFTYCVLGDGCLQEGVAHEAMSLAGHLKLGKLIFLYDDNKIQIDGETDLAFTENVAMRMQSYGFHCLLVNDGDNDIEAINSAIIEAKSVSDRPSFIQIRTTIGKGSRKQGTEKVHGAPLGAQDVESLKKSFDFDDSQSFVILKEVQEYFASVKKKGEALEDEWRKLFENYAAHYPEMASDFRRRQRKELPRDLMSLLPRYSPSDPEIATRKLSENVLNAIADALPELMGGSADLTGSNLTKWKGSIDFQHELTALGNYAGRYIRFGVREHGMAGIINGLAAYGLIIPFGATFLNFITYAWGAVRLSALSNLRCLYIMTHDSIGLGEDGPTHQPVETMAALRALPNTHTWRPADGNEVSGAYLAALSYTEGPSVLALSRQNLPQLPNSSIENTLKGAYIMHEGKSPVAIIVATGSEVSIAYQAALSLSKEGLEVNVVSMPCWEAFEEQSKEYKQSIFPGNVPVLSFEAMGTLGWSKYAHVTLGMPHFGASAPYKDIYKKLGFTPENVAGETKKMLAYYQSHGIPCLAAKP